MKVQEVEEKITTRIAGLEDQETRLHDWLDCIRQVGDIAEKMGYNRPSSQGDEGSLMQAFEEMVEQAGVDDTPLLTAGSSVKPMEEEILDQPSEADELDEGHYDRDRETEPVTVEAAPESSDERDEDYESPDDRKLDALRAALTSSNDAVEEEVDSETVETVSETSERPPEIRELPDEGNIEQVMEALTRPEEEVVVEAEPEPVTVEVVPEDTEEQEESHEMPDRGNLDQLRESLNRPKDEKKAKKRFGGFMSSFFAAEE